MAKRNLRSTKTKLSAKNVEKGKGNKIWIFLFLLLLLLLIICAYKFLDLEIPFDDLFKEPDLVEESLDNIQVKWDKKEEELDISEDMPEVSSEVLEVKVKKITQPSATPRAKRKFGKKKYIKVEDCVYSTCKKEVLKILKQEELPIIQRKYTKKTRYFELISDSVYNLQRAKQKISILNKYNKNVGAPYMVAYKNRYKISFGQFPKEETGMRMKTSLAELYPKIEMNFVLEPREQKYKVTSIFVGPFNQEKAERVLDLLQSYPDFESSEIISKL